MVARSNVEHYTVRAGAVILASASLCPADPDLVWAPLNGQALIAYSLAACLTLSALDALIVVVDRGREAQAEEILTSLAGRASSVRRRVVTPAVVAGLAGATMDRHTPPLASERRRDAALAGVASLQMLAPGCDWVVVHEATRPLASAALFEAGLATAARAGTGAIAIEPVKETLKRAPTGVGGLVAETLPRAQLARAQTPQVYRVADLLAALRRLPPDADPADEATIAADAGLPLVTFAGGHDNLRATTRADLPIIAAMLEQRASAPGA